MNCLWKRSVLKAVALLVFVPLSWPVHSHELVRVSPVTPEIEVSQIAKVAVTLRARDNVPGCGLDVDYGDGTVEFVRVQGPNPSGTIQHIYRQPGVATIRVEGKTQFKGLGTTFACSGNAQVTSVRVLPAGTIARRAAGEAAKQAAAEREQAEARAAVQRAQAETQAAQAEAQRQRMLADQANQRARDDRLAAERAARNAALQRAVAASGTSPSPDSPKTKTEPSKAKSSLDL